jgi:23S rRNA pseudouridine1911/1915/1917 synthase
VIERKPPDPARAVVLRYTHPSDGTDQRLDLLLTQVYAPYPTRASARKACERGEMAVNGLLSESSRWVRPGDEVVGYESTHGRAPPLQLRLKVVFEDEVMAVIDKPPGFPTSGAHAATIERALPANLAPTCAEDALLAPRCVHRLDAQTGGVLVVAKTRSAHAALGQAFEQRRVHKRYRALVVGTLSGAGSIDAPIDGREARSRYVVVGQTPVLKVGGVSTVDLFPETGRTHQLRRHLAGLGHPVLGDTLYGEPGRVLHGKGLFLFAAELTVPHPVSGDELRVCLDEPAKFAGYRAREAARHARWSG